MVRVVAKTISPVVNCNDSSSKYSLGSYLLFQDYNHIRTIRACSWQRLMPFSVSIFVFALEEDLLQQGDYFTSQIEVAIRNNLCTCAHFLCWIQPLYMCPFSLLDMLNQPGV